MARTPRKPSKESVKRAADRSMDRPLDVAHGSMVAGGRDAVFVASYLATSSASYAAKACGLDLHEVPPARGSYVYFILCPERKRILYVGKGTGQRMTHHIRDAIRGEIKGLRKHVAIMSFVREGKRPIAVVFRSGLTGDAALDLERMMILAIGPANLENSSGPVGSRNSRLLANVHIILSDVKPFCRWLDDIKPPPAKFGMYAWIVSGLRANETRLRHAVYGEGCPVPSLDWRGAVGREYIASLQEPDGR